MIKGPAILKTSHKIHSLDQLRDLAVQWRAEGKRVVLCHGTFDLVHPGHLEHLRQARDLGDILVVTITSGSHVAKGPGRPIFDDWRRANFLAALDLVDFVAVVNDATAVPAIVSLQPTIYCKGEEYAALERRGQNYYYELEWLTKYKGQMVFTTGFQASASHIINQHLSSLGLGGEAFIAQLKNKYNVNDVLSWLEKAKELSVGVIGESIIDEYVYVTPEGKSPKDSIINWRQLGSERFPGGADIVTGHLQSLCHEVIRQSNTEPIVKRRYVHKPFAQKVFETMGIQNQSVGYPLQFIYRPSLTVVADYGHGLIPNWDEAEKVLTNCNYVALTVQTNSSNWGFNLATKWPGANYVVLDEMELRLACQNKVESVPLLMEMQMARMQSKYFAVTLGHEGCFVMK